MKKYLFLEIDGVLNTYTWSRGDDNSGQYIEPNLLNKLRSIVKYTDCEIVLSSAWRLDDNYLNSLRKHGYPLDELPIVDVTPRLPNKNRGIEIEEWLSKQLKFSHMAFDRDVLINNCKSSGIFNYLILDSNTNMLFNQRYNFIHTPFNLGITDRVVSCAIEQLNTPYWELPYIEDMEKYK